MMFMCISISRVDGTNGWHLDQRQHMVTVADETSNDGGRLMVFVWEDERDSLEE